MAARRWVGRLTDEEIERHGLLYSPGIERVVLPVYYDGRLVKYQTRRVHASDTKPKYLTYGKSPYTFIAHKDSGSCVIVEDMYSAIICNRLMGSVALLGTSMSDDTFDEIIGLYDRFYVFLDDDNPEVVANAHKITARLKYFRPVKHVMSDRDPKDHTMEELVDILKF